MDVCMETETENKSMDRFILLAKRQNSMTNKSNMCSYPKNENQMF